MKALELATWLEVKAINAAIAGNDIPNHYHAAGAELRRLAEVNAELVAALENMIAASLPDETDGHCTSDIENAAYFARGALAKAKE